MDESITLERLRYLEEQDLTYLFRERKLGEKVEFRFKIQQWKIGNVSTNIKFEYYSVNKIKLFYLRDILMSKPAIQYL